MTATEQWKKILQDLLLNGKPSSPRDLATLELINYHSEIDMSRPTVAMIDRKLSKQFMCAEAYWILSGDFRVKTIAPYAPSIAKFSDDGDVFFGAYGPRIVEQDFYVEEKLATARDTRQAVLTIWRENPPQTKDVPCTVAVQFLIRDGKLHCIDTMRSSDVWLGWPYDVFNFTMLTLRTLIRLREWVKLQLGTLYLNAGSQHLYLKNKEGAEACSNYFARVGTELQLNADDFNNVTQLMEWLKINRHTPEWVGVDPNTI